VIAAPAVEGAGLAVPDEPVAERDWARARIEESPGDLAGLLGEDGVAGALWQAWRGDLEGRGLDWGSFAAVVGGYSRELWLWAMGERTWAQCASGLAGRVIRRAPAPPPGPSLGS